MYGDFPEPARDARISILRTSSRSSPPEPRRRNRWHSLRKVVNERNWTQRRAAEVLGIAPPDMSDLMRGRLARFSQERFERFLNALDMDVNIQVGPRRPRKKHATMTVEFVGAF